MGREIASPFRTLEGGATLSKQTSIDLDLLGVEEELTEEERSLRQVVRRFVTDHVLDHINEWYLDGVVPKDLAPRLGDLGLLGMHLAGYGCAGANATSYGLACLELEAADSGLRSFVSVQGSLAMFPIHAYGTEDQRRQWLPAMATGRAIGCFGLTEPDHGSDPGNMQTVARRSGTDWLLSGTKMWITNGEIADVAVVWAQTDGGIRGFLVPRDAPGFSSRPVPRKLSLRASITSELTFDDVRLPAESELPGAVGLDAALKCLTEARFGIAWGAVGAARSCLQTALDYSTSRVQFGRPIAAFQLTQKKLADMSVEYSKAQLVAMRIGRLKDRGDLRPQQVSVAKLNNVREALRIARTARTILGANGITADYGVMRHAANLESVLTYEGTEEIHTLVIGRELTGLGAFR